MKAEHQILHVRGFTLMELLVTIAIISILAAIASVSYISVQKKIRDNRRLTDLKGIQSAFEQYFGANSSSYPSSCAAIIPPTTSTYLPAGYPADPKTNLTYDTTATCSSSSYCFCAAMEASVVSGNSTSASCTFAQTGGPYFCVAQQQ